MSYLPNLRKSVLKYASLSLLAVYLMGCDSSDSTDEPPKTLECKLQLSVNLPTVNIGSEATIFDPDNPTVFGYTTDHVLRDGFNHSYQIQVQFITDTVNRNSWDVLIGLAGTLLSLEPDDPEATGPLSALMTFNDNGLLESTIPEQILTEEALLDPSNYYDMVQVRLNILAPTQFDSPFEVTELTSSCL